MIIKTIIGLFGVFLCLFLFWQKLKEDYEGEVIFTVSFATLFAGFLGLIISAYFVSAWWFWVSFVSSMMAFSVLVKKFEIKYFEALEAYVVSFLPIYGLVMVYGLVEGVSVGVVVSLLQTVLLLVLFSYVNKRYKGYSWYKSGRVGFSGLLILGLFFLTRSAIALAFGDVISFVGKSDAIISSGFSFVSFLMLFNLARRTL